MPRPTQNLANELVSHIRYIDQTRRKVETLFSQNLIVARDINFVYSGLFLELVTSFEKFIEDLFAGMLSNLLTHPSRNIRPRIIFNSPSVCRDIIRGDRNYVDWLPYDITIKRSTAFFRNGLPFTNLTIQEKAVLKKISWIRNAIAHKSNHSFSVFENNVIAGLPLTPIERTPIGYLRSIYINFPVSQRRFEEIASEIINISNTLVS